MLLNARPTFCASQTGIGADSSRAMLKQSFRASSARQSSRVVTVQANLDSNSLLSANTGSLLGPKSPSGPSLTSSGSSTPAIKLEDVPLTSGTGVDYTALRDFLKEAKWREAEDETRAKLIEAAGPGAQKRNWVYWSEVSSIPVEDMQTMDALWKASSNGKFGYSVQREIWVQNKRQWTKFFKAIKWVQGENNIYLKWPQEFVYSTDAPKGHLPLTNCLRGTRLFEAVLEHPAFASKAAAAALNGSEKAQPDWLNKK